MVAFGSNFLFFFCPELVTQKALGIFSLYTKWYKYVWKISAGQKSIKKAEFVVYFGWNNLNRRLLVFYSKDFM